MKLQLFLEDKEIELNKDMQFPLNKSFENLERPTDIINDFSKTIDIPFTKHNCEVLGNIYRLDKTIIKSDAHNIGINIDPAKKIKMRLVYNCEVVMEGYAKFLSTNYDSKGKVFKITIFGALGQVIQEMQKVVTDPALLEKDEYIGIDDKEKYLIDYPIVPGRLNSEYVKRSWQNDALNTDDPYYYQVEDFDIIGFAPAHRGNYKDFNNNETYLTVNGVPQYRSLNAMYEDRWRSHLYNKLTAGGMSAADALNYVNKAAQEYKPGELVKAINYDWEWNEYRSYQMKPYIYFNKLFYIFANKCKKLTGYSLRFDYNWTRKDNPYWSTLCYMLDFVKLNDPVEEVLFNNSIAACTVRTNTDSETPGVDNLEGFTEKSFFNIPITSEEKNLSNIYIKKFPITLSATWHSQPDMKVDFKLADEVFSTSRYDFEFPNDELYYYVGLLVVNYKVYDVVNGQETLITSGQRWAPTTNSVSKLAKITEDYPQFTLYNWMLRDWTTKITNNSTTDVNGNVTRTDTIFFPETKIKLGAPLKGQPRIRLQISVYSPRHLKKDYGTTGLYYVNNRFWNPPVRHTNIFSIKTGNIKIDADPKYNTKVDLEHIYKNEEPLFNIILQYTKMLGMVWDIDESNKTIIIKPRGDVFKNYTVTDWTNKIDKTRGMTVEPIVFSKSDLKFNYENVDGYNYKTYKEKFGHEYGEKLLTTQYKFKSKPENLFDKIMPSCASTRPILKPYSIINYSPGETLIKENLDYDIIDCDSTDQKEAEQMNNWYFRLPNKFFNSVIDWPHITDDVYDKEKRKGISCWHYYDRIRQEPYQDQINCIPQFNIAYEKNNGQVVGCLFNMPKLDYTYSKLPTKAVNNYIYDLFWKRYLNERYNIQNKKITCYVKLSPLDYIQFKYNKLVTISNQLFMINKIIDFDINNPNITTKVELIQITDIESYINN